MKPWIVQDVSPDGDPYGEEDLGTMVLLHDDQSVNGSSKWGIIAPCPTYTPPPTEPCDGGNSSTVYYDNIVQCNPNTYYCAAGVTINDVPGNKVGKTQDGVRDLIHMGGGKQSEGTVTVRTRSLGLAQAQRDFDYTITGGSLNPIAALQGQTITQSEFDHHRPLDYRCSPFKRPVEVIHYRLFEAFHHPDSSSECQAQLRQEPD